MKKILLHFVAAMTACAFTADAQYSNLIGSRLLIHPPASSAGFKTFRPSNDGDATNANNWGRAIDSFWYNLPLEKPADSTGCTAITAGSLTGKFALIYRTTCNFSEKAYNAQLAGAMGVIIVNNVPGQIDFTMSPGTNASLVNIPVVIIPKDQGDAINTDINSGNPVYVSISSWGFNFPHDLGIVPNSVTLAHNFAIPKFELASGSPLAYRNYTGAFIANFGTSDENNLVLKSRVEFTPAGSSTSTLQYEDSVKITQFNAIDSVIEMFSPNHSNLQAISQTGTLKYNYTLTSSSVDDVAFDNSDEFTVDVTDSIYSKGRYNFSTASPYFTVGYRFSDASDQVWGPLYYIREGGHEAIKAQFTVSNGDNATSLSGSEVYILVYKWQDGVVSQDNMMQQGEVSLIGGAYKQFTSADSNYDLYTVDIYDIATATNRIKLDANSNYWIAANVPGSLYFACDGVPNYYTRSYAAFHSTTGDTLYNTPQFQGNNSDLGNNPTGNLLHFPFSSGNASLLIDSANYLGMKGLIPAIALHVSKDTQTSGPNSVYEKNNPFSNIELYPNPASDKLTVEVAAKDGKYIHTAIINAMGQMIRKESHAVDHNGTTAKFEVNTTGLADGNYYLLLRDEHNNVVARSFVVKGNK